MLIRTHAGAWTAIPWFTRPGAARRSRGGASKTAGQAPTLPLVLPELAVLAYQALLRQPVLAIGGILLAWQVFGSIFGSVFRLALALLYPGVGYG